MDISQTIECSCPNCGSIAIRHYFISHEPIHSRCPGDRVMQTECPVCDYLMVLCSLDGSVIEAYASSTSATVKKLLAKATPAKNRPAVPLGKKLLISDTHLNTKISA